MRYAEPIVLGPNQPAARFYQGGPRIARFRGLGEADPHTPEDWIASATTLFGEAELGLTRLPDGRPLVERLGEEPEAWLGKAHSDRFGTDPMLLVKLLDAGQRLPVHVHPDGAFAGRHLGRPHGKAESWLILEGGLVYLGFRHEVERATLDAWVEGQDVDAMLAAMNVVEVGPGDTVFVPAGLTHAIGEGVFLIELQEPEDLSVLMEWRDFAIDGRTAGHLDLGFEVALGCVNLAATSARRIGELVRGEAEGSLLPAEADRYFRADRVRGGATIEQGYGVLVVTAGEGTLAGTAVRKGTTVLIPHAAGELRLGGDLDAVLCRPPG